MKIILVILLSVFSYGGFFQEDDKHKHMVYSVSFGAIGGLTCAKDSWGLTKWEAVACGTAIGMIPGIIKEASDQHSYGGWDNRDLAADAIGAFLGSVGTVTILEFNSGRW